MISRKTAFKFLLLGPIGLVVLVAVFWFALTQPLFWRVRSSTVVNVDPARLERHVRMLSEAFVPRDWTHPVNLDLVAAYIKKEFEVAGGAVSEQPYSMEGKIYRNVVATFGPRTSERIVVGAHYDAFGPYPAADDNASGVAGLIEIAYLLGKSTLPIRVELVAFTLEEPKAAGALGLFRSRYGGSAVHAKSLKEQGAKVRLMIALEMLGYFCDKEGIPGLSQPTYAVGLPLAGQFYPNRWPACRK